MFYSALSFLIIVFRAVLYFQDQILGMIALDVLSLILFACLISIKKELIYLGIMTFLPSVSLYLFLQNKPISDLMFVSFLLTTCIIIHGKISLVSKKDGPIYYFFMLYLFLFIAFLFSNYLNLFIDLQLQSVFIKYFNYLLLTIYACFAFLMVYRKEDNDSIANAVMVAAFAYLTASTLGYFYIEKLDMTEFSLDITKELFRYPGFSNSNYIGNVLVLMAAVAYSIKKHRLALYTFFVLFVALLSQSRSVLLSGIVFILYCALHRFINNQVKVRLTMKHTAATLFIIASLVIVTQTNAKLRNISANYFSRVTLQTATENITERFDLVQSALQQTTSGFKNALFGVGYIRDGENPHNSFIQALLLFGLLPSLTFTSYLLNLSWRFPILLFAVIASFVEILFFTSSYDFLFFILLVTVAYNASPPSKPYADQKNVP